MPLRTLRRFTRTTRGRFSSGDNVRITASGDLPTGVFTLRNRVPTAARAIIGPRNFRSRLGPVATTGKGELELQRKILALAFRCRQLARYTAFTLCPKDTGTLSISLEWADGGSGARFRPASSGPLDPTAAAGGLAAGVAVLQTQVPYHIYQERNVGYIAQATAAAVSRARRTTVVTFTGVQLVFNNAGLPPLRIRRRDTKVFNLSRFIDHIYDGVFLTQRTPLGPPRLMDGRGIVRRTHWWYR